MQNKELQAFVFDLIYDRFFGVIVYVRLFNGCLSINQQIKILSNDTELHFQIESLGVDTPFKKINKKRLIDGEIGWFTANIKDIRQVQVGNIVIDSTNTNPSTDFLIGKDWKKHLFSKPNLYCSFFAGEKENFNDFSKALFKLQLQNANVTIEPIESKLLGKGFNCGFLGVLQGEIFTERLKQEYSCEVVITIPAVRYQIIDCENKVYEIINPNELKNKQIKEIKEPFIYIKVITPEKFIGKIMQLFQQHRGVFQKQEKTTDCLYTFIYHLPFAEFIQGFYGKIKNHTQGYASLDYEPIGFFSSSVEKIDILINGKQIDDLSFFSYQKTAEQRARKICLILKNTLERQNFTLIIQACIGKKIIVRETIDAFRKNVVANLYGGDRTRKMKLWKKQQRGKKKLLEKGNLNFTSSELKKVLKKGLSLIDDD